MHLGPILHFRGQSAEGTARYAVVLIDHGDAAPAVIADERRIAPSARFPLPDGLCWWRFEFDLILTEETRRHVYMVADREYAFWTPGRRDALRVAYASCNGDAAETSALPPRPGRNRLWETLARQHEERPFHLMIHGGDQIYADGAWREIRRQRRRRYRDLPRLLLSFYLRRYVWLWRQPEIARVLANVPALMCWDDHDIFDGWGSLRVPARDASMADEVFRAARTACSLLQHGSLPDESCAALHWHARLGHTGFIGLDVRSERTPEQVLSARGLGYFSVALEDLRECQHLFILSSTPLAGLDVGPIERAYRWVGARSLIPSDVRDQWSSHDHLQQWRQIAGLLFAHARRTGARISILSGEIHHGAHAVLSHQGAEIHQYVSSGIAHRPLWRPITRMLDRMTRRGWAHGEFTVTPQAMDDDGRTLISSENWMALDVPRDEKPRVTWHCKETSWHHGSGSVEASRFSGGHSCMEIYRSI